LSFLFSFHSPVPPPDLHSFPTRRSSDLPTEIGWYTFDRHYDSVLRLVEALDLSALTVVVQDWGGPIGLRFAVEQPERVERLVIIDRKSTRLNSSHDQISYAVFCLKKKKK